MFFVVLHRLDPFLMATGQHEAHLPGVSGGAELGVLVGVIQIIRFTGHMHPHQRGLEILRQRKFIGHFDDALDGRQRRAEDKFRPQPGGGQHGVQENGAVGHVAVAIGQRGVGGGQFAQRQFGKGRTGLADGFRHEIADGEHGLARRFASHQLLCHGRGVGAPGGAIEQCPVQLIVIIIRVANEIIDARGPQPLWRGACFRREGFDVVRRPRQGGGPRRSHFGGLQTLV